MFVLKLSGIQMILHSNHIQRDLQMLLSLCYIVNWRMETMNHRLNSHSFPLSKD